MAQQETSGTSDNTSTADAGGTGGLAGQGGAIADPLELQTSSLPDANFNASYGVDLEVTGGDGSVTFSLADGALPGGLELTGGAISGAPLQDGDFSFTVEVEDEAGQTDSVALTLTVRRKRWLAYVADDDTQGRDLLYLVDLTSELFPKMLLSDDVPAAGDVPFNGYRFSADGSMLGFAVDATGTNVYDLYVVDVSGEIAGEPQQVNTEGPVALLFDFAPDGSRILYSEEITADSWELRSVDLARGGPEPPVTIGVSAGSSVRWVADNLVAFAVPDGIAWSLFEDGEYSSPVPLTEPTFGSFEAVDPQNRKLLLTNVVTSCASAGWLVDLEADTFARAPADTSYRWVTYNRQLSYVVHPDGASGFLLYEAHNTAGDPLGVISPATSCEAIWSAGGRHLVTLDGASPPRLVYSMVTDSGVTSETVGGSYDNPGYLPNSTGFISDDHIVFAAGNGLFESRAIDGVPGDAVRINPELGDGDLVGLVRTAPNGAWVSFVAPQDTAGQSEAFAIDTSGDTPGHPRQLADFSTGWTVSEFTFSPDSARLAFIVNHGSTSPWAKSLRIADMLHPTALARQVTPATCFAGEPVTCQEVVNFKFQP